MTTTRYADSLRRGSEDKDQLVRILASHGIRYSGKFEHLNNPESQAGLQKWREGWEAEAHRRALVRNAQARAQAATRTQAEKVEEARATGPAAAKRVLQSALDRFRS